MPRQDPRLLLQQPRHANHKRQHLCLQQLRRRLQRHPLRKVRPVLREIQIILLQQPRHPDRHRQQRVRLQIVRRRLQRHPLRDVRPVPRGNQHVFVQQPRHPHRIQNVKYVHVRTLHRRVVRQTMRGETQPQMPCRHCLARRQLCCGLRFRQVCRHEHRIRGVQAMRRAMPAALLWRRACCLRFVPVLLPSSTA